MDMAKRSHVAARPPSNSTKIVAPVLLRLAANEGASVLKPLLVVTDENPDESIRVEPDHHRDRPSIGKGFRPFLCGRPAISVADLFFTRNNTVPSGSNVKVTRSPSFMCKRSLISFGIVV